MRKILVTGGCGYIGSHVARAFKFENPNNQVISLDIVKREHTLKHIDGFFIDDFASDASLATIVDMAPDIIVHCAGTSLVGPSMTDPAEYWDNNVTKTLKLLDTIRIMGKRPTIMFSSSASVYGEPESIPIKETARIQPISPYGNTKATVERILKDYGGAYGIDTICFRYFNAAGAMPQTYDLGQEPGATHIIARVLEASLKGRVFSINGEDYNTPDGTCIRDYVHVWDIATAHVQGALYAERENDLGPQAGRTAYSHVFNLGTNTGISNKEIVDYVAKKYGLIGVNYGHRRPGDPAVLVADAHDVKTWLGWSPTNSTLENIVDSAYNWYRTR